jgi:hypothetical protein
MRLLGQFSQGLPAQRFKLASFWPCIVSQVFTAWAKSRVQLWTVTNTCRAFE